MKNPLRYQVQYFDDESGLHYNRFRYYDPITGRFIHQDHTGVAWDTLYTLVDAAYYPIDIVTRPLGFTTHAVDRTNARINDALDAAQELKANTVANWECRNWEGLGSNLAAIGMVVNPRSLVKGNVTPAYSKKTIAAQSVKQAARRKVPNDFTEFKSMPHKKAAAGEYNAHALMEEKGYKPLGNTDGKYKPGATGIDGIYAHPNPPPDFVIIEAKYNTARLGKTKTGKQMSNDWVTEKRLEKAGMNERDRRKILRSLKKGNNTVEKLIIRNKPDGTLVVKTLDKNANIIGKAVGF
ncbi:hypothetical protein L4C35_07705 [Photobacterium kagoshimensis]